MPDEPDLLGPSQLGLGLEDTRPDPTKVDPNEVRQELIAILEIARAARDEAPWDRRTHRYHQVVFPQMASWLPDDEADQLCFEFAQELERIERLLAA
jgi:DNA transposition AAA+ family ATPase